MNVHANKAPHWIHRNAAKQKTKRSAITQVRTVDLTVNSRTLYLLSYESLVDFQLIGYIKEISTLLPTNSRDFADSRRKT
jgi:hypothetical protein